MDEYGQTRRISLRDEESLHQLLRHLQRQPGTPLSADLERDLKMFLQEVPLGRLRIPEGNDL